MIPQLAGPPRVNESILGTLQDGDLPLLDQKLREFHYQPPVRLGDGGAGQRLPIVGHRSGRVRQVVLEDRAVRGYADDSLTPRHQAVGGESYADPAVLVLDLQPTAQESVSGSRRVGWHHGVVESGAGIDYRRLIEGVGTCQLGSRRIVGSTASSRSGTLGSW